MTKFDDLIEHLHIEANVSEEMGRDGSHVVAMRDAAAALKAQQAEIERLENALTDAEFWLRRYEAGSI